MPILNGVAIFFLKEDFKMVVDVKPPRSQHDYMIIPQMPSVHLIFADGSERREPLGSRALHDSIKFESIDIKRKIAILEKQYVNREAVMKALQGKR